MSGEDVIENIARHILPKKRGLLSIGVLASSGGSNLQALIDFSKTKNSYFSVSVVIANNPDAYALTRAKHCSIENHLVDHRTFHHKEMFEQKIIEHLQHADIELVVLAGFMRVFSTLFLRRFDQRIINLHPSLLPKHPGLHAIKSALLARDKITGCTVHLVDEGLDTGPIIAQSSCPIGNGESLATITKRIQALEHALLPEIVNRIAKAVITRDFA